MDTVVFSHGWGSRLPPPMVSLSGDSFFILSRLAKSESGKWFFAVPFQIFYDKNHFTKFNLQNLHNLLFTLCAKTSKRKKNLQMLIFQNLFHKTSLFVRNCFFTIGKIQEHFTTGGLMMFCDLYIFLDVQ